MKTPKKPAWWDEFVAFAIKGNAMALAVGTIIGAAFSTITKSITDDIIMPIVAIFMGGIDFSELKITLPRLFGEAPLDDAGRPIANTLKTPSPPPTRNPPRKNSSSPKSATC